VTGSLHGIEVVASWLTPIRLNEKQLNGIDELIVMRDKP
jgi:hypothetical protein